jgi:hypothetical protein
MIDVLQQRYEVRGRRSRSEESVPKESDEAAYEEKAAPEQAAFTFELP